MFKRALAGSVIVIFDVILVKAWLAARTAAAAHHGPAPSPVRYGVILVFSVILLAVLLTAKKNKTSSRNGGSRNGGSRNGSSYTWSGRS